MIDDYTQTIINQLRSDYVASGRQPDADVCVLLLTPGHPENRKIRDYCVKHFEIESKEFDYALRNMTIKTELGTVPCTPGQFVQVMVERMSITARYNGILDKHETPYLPDNGGKMFISPHLWDNEDFATLIKTKFHCSISILDFELDCRRIAADLRLPFQSEKINDAVRQWHREARTDRIFRVLMDIKCADSIDIREKGQASLYRLFETCFECPHGIEFAVAVFNKFIWQVKRKMMSLPITDHLMPVLLGKQGNGKSTLIRHMLGPVDELTADTDFRQITDDRNIDLWRNFVLFLDEMGRASAADMDVVKNVVSSRTLTLRPMRSNSTVQVVQNATFIGTSNAASLTEILRDPTGTRRYIGLTMIDSPDREVINSIDWAVVWQSVDERAVDPMTACRSTLTSVQEEDRTITPFDHWMAALTPSSPLFASYEGAHRFSATELFCDFSEHEKTYFPGNRMLTSVQGFGLQMKACKDSKFIREPERRGSVKNAYIWRK